MVWKAFLLPFMLSTTTTGELIELTDANFDSYTHRDNLLVEFYAPWCGHCQRLEPIYTEAAEILGLEGIDIAKINVEEHKEKRRLHKIGGLPTLMNFHNGFGKAYMGPRVTVDDILDVARRHAQPAAPLLTTQAEIDAVVNGKNPAVIGYYPHNGNEENAFRIVSNWMREQFNFFKVTNLKLCRKNWSGASSAGTKKGKTPRRTSALGVVRPYDSQQRVVFYQGDMTNNPVIDDFIWKNSIGNLNLLHPKTTEHFLKHSDKPMLVAFMDEDGDIEATLKPLQAIAEKFKESVIVTASFVELYEEHFDEKFEHELKAGQLLMYNPKEITLAAARPKDTAEKFVENYLAGTADWVLKSAAVATPYEDGLHEYNGESLLKAVQSDDNLFVLVYVNWCGHCKAIKPIFKDFAKTMQFVEGLQVGQIDSDSNSMTAGFVSGGFPAFRIRKAGGKVEEANFEGRPDVDGMRTYLMREIPSLFNGKTEL